MSILIVAATEAEIKPLIQAFGPRLDYLVTGVGMTATGFALGARLAKHPCQLAVNLGIAGSFDQAIEPGNLREISEDIFADLGAENDEEFLSLSSLDLGEVVFKPSAHVRELSPLVLEKARAITVNTVHGNSASIQKIVKRFNPQIESMEGAAFFYACQKMKVPCLQIRAISNYVERRNRDAWRIGPAIENLNRFAIRLAESLLPPKS